jgi:hypothetical protein
VARLAQALFFGVSVLNPVTYGLAAALQGLIVIAACLVPGAARCACGPSSCASRRVKTECEHPERVIEAASSNTCPPETPPGKDLLLHVGVVRQLCANSTASG